MQVPNFELLRIQLRFFVGFYGFQLQKDSEKNTVYTPWKFHSENAPKNSTVGRRLNSPFWGYSSVEKTPRFGSIPLLNC